MARAPDNAQVAAALRERLQAMERAAAAVAASPARLADLYASGGLEALEELAGRG